MGGAAPPTEQVLVLEAGGMRYPLPTGLVPVEDDTGGVLLVQALPDAGAPGRTLYRPDITGEGEMNLVPIGFQLPDGNVQLA